MRVFAGLPLPRAAADLMDSALSGARQASPHLRWVLPAGFHVTLHFFGDVPSEGVAALQHVFDDPALNVPAIPARLGKVGQFPPRGSPRVLWVGLEHGEAEIRSYWNLFEKKIAPLGWAPDERGFSAHITVARAGRASATAVFPHLDASGAEFLFEECVLFQSVLSAAGAEYLPLKKISLGGGTTG